MAGREEADGLRTSEDGGRMKMETVSNTDGEEASRRHFCGFVPLPEGCKSQQTPELLVIRAETEL